MANNCESPKCLNKKTGVCRKPNAWIIFSKHNKGKSRDELTDLYSKWKKGDKTYFPFNNTPSDLCKAIGGITKNKSVKNDNELKECKEKVQKLEKENKEHVAQLEKENKEHVAQLEKEIVALKLKPTKVEQSIQVSSNFLKNQELHNEIDSVLELFYKAGIRQDSSGEPYFSGKKGNVGYSEKAKSLLKTDLFINALKKKDIREYLNSKGWTPIDFNIAIQMIAVS